MVNCNNYPSHLQSDNHPLVSVVVPIYNTEKYLKECIESLLRQSYDKVEFVLVDDGSEDTSSSICDGFAKQDSRIKVIHKKNEGRTRARITGVDAAKGDYIIFVDADDYVESTYVEHLISSLIKNDVDVACCQCSKVYEDRIETKLNKELGRFDKNEIQRIINTSFLHDKRLRATGIPVYLCGKVFRREMIKEFLPIGLNLWNGEDAVTFSAILQECDSLFISKEFLYCYRQYDGQTTQIQDRNKWDMNLYLFDKLDTLDKNGNLRKTQLPLFIFNHILKWLRYRNKASESFVDFKNDMEYALNNKTMERLYIHSNIKSDSIKRNMLIYCTQHKMYRITFLLLNLKKYLSHFISK